jgi:hypothetical protein
MSQVRISVTGGPESETGSLWDWLRNEPELRGRLSQDSTTAPDEMGGLTEIVVSLIGAPSLAVLARSLQVWLTQQRSDVSVELTDPHGRTVKLSAKRVEDGEHLVERVIQLAGQDAQDTSDRR